MKITLTLLIVLLACAGAAWLRAPKPEPTTPESALRAFLAQQGQLCLGKNTWPLIVTRADERAGASNAVQMPVLERLGVVRGEPQGEDTRYQLTALGERSYLPRAGGGKDLCAGAIALDRVQESRRERDRVSVRYTYRFQPNTWMGEPEALRVFPWVAQLSAGQGTAVLEQRFAVREGSWAALGPSE